MKRFLLPLLLFFFLVIPGASALEEREIEPVMTQALEKILVILNDANLTKAQRYAEIDALTSPFFDFTLMAKLSLGKSGWIAATPEQRTAYVSLFAENIKRSFLNKAELYKDEKVTILAPVNVKNRIHLASFIVQKGEKQEVVYKFYRSKKNGWLIYDVDVLGVSIIQTYRSQFDSELKRGSMDSLLEKLRTTEV